MPPLSPVELDPNYTERQVDLVVDNDNLGYRNLSK
jgi:hypothetical protein